MRRHRPPLTALGHWNSSDRLQGVTLSILLIPSQDASSSQQVPLPNHCCLSHHPVGFFSVLNVSTIYNEPVRFVHARAVHSRQAHSNISDNQDIRKRFLHTRAFLLVAQQRKARGPWCDERDLPSSLRKHCENRKEISL